MDNGNNLFKFVPIDLTDLIAISALSIGFILSINANMNELAMSLATGFFGYIGGYSSASSKSNNRKKPTIHTSVTADEIKPINTENKNVEEK